MGALPEYQSIDTTSIDPDTPWIATGIWNKNEKFECFIQSLNNHNTVLRRTQHTVKFPWSSYKCNSPLDNANSNNELSGDHWTADSPGPLISLPHTLDPSTDPTITAPVIYN